MTSPEFRQPELPPSPRITFLHDSFLLIGDKALEIPDLTPAIFDIKIQLSLDALRQLIKRHRYNNAEQLSTLPPINMVRIGRLSMPGKEDYVLSQSGMTLFESINDPSDEADRIVIVQHDRVDDLMSEYQPFWEKLEKQKLSPTIESGITGLSRAVDGTWLSVKVSANKKIFPFKKPPVN